MIQTNRPSGIFVCSWYKSINLNEVKIKYFYTLFPFFSLIIVSTLVGTMIDSLYSLFVYGIQGFPSNTFKDCTC